MPDIEKTCVICEKTFVTHVTKTKPGRATCCRECNLKLLSQKSSGENNAMYGVTVRTKATHPEWAAKIREGTKGINAGDKNGMKDPEVRARMSKTRRERVTSDPAYRKHMSDVFKKTWADGKMAHARVGQCDWHDHIKPDGTLIKLQGTWELAYAKYLDSQNTLYEVHHGRIPYVDDAGETHNYYPDFYLVETDEYIDIKNPYYEVAHAPKIECIRKSNPGLKLSIVGKQLLLELGIELPHVKPLSPTRESDPQ